MRRIVFTIAGIVLAAFFASCATKVKAQRMAPAAFPVAGIKKIAVAEFDATCMRCSDLASDLSWLVTNKLGTHEFYQVIAGKPEVGANAAAGGGATPEWQSWGKKYGADAILAGTVVDAHINQTVTYRTVEERIYTGRYHDRVFIEDGKVKKKREEIVRTEKRYIPTVRNYAKMHVEVALLDVRSGKQQIKQEYHENMSRYLEGEVRVRDVVVADEMFERLVAKIADEIVKDMVPHQVAEKILLEQDKETSEGSKRARQGDWEGARLSWQAVVARDPSSDKAWYNLGVAAEIATHYDEALTNYRRAVELYDKKLYRDALQRAENRRREAVELQQQMKGR